MNLKTDKSIDHRSHLQTFHYVYNNKRQTENAGEGAAPADPGSDPVVPSVPSGASGKSVFADGFFRSSRTFSALSNLFQESLQ